MDEQEETVRKVHLQGHHRSDFQVNQMNLVLWSIAGVLALALVGAFAIYFLRPEWWPWGSTSSSSVISSVTDTEAPKSQGKPSGYVAVFLTNNQVYFGKISDLSGQYPMLRDVFYLRAQRSLVPPDDEETSPGARLRVERRTAVASAGQNERLTLLKLGSELHGPVDEIKLNRDHILYIEEIKDDSKVYQAIVKYQTQQE